MRSFRVVFITTAFIALALASIGLFLVTKQTTLAAEKPDTVKYLPVPTGTYKIDPPHTVVGFSIRHLEINWVSGRFKDVEGSIVFDERDITRSTVSFKTKIDSVDTGIGGRDKHLKTADFFDAAKFPEMTFQSTKVDRKGKNYMLTGDLTIKGVTKSVSFPFTMTGAVKDPWGGTRFGISAETRINRRDFGITYGKPLSGGGLDVGDEVTVNLDFEAVKTEPKS
jgi:polyisoprenoid-binding protein YceI